MSVVWEELYVAVGTVFNHVLLWKATGELNQLGQAKVLQRLKGHEV